MTVLRAHSALPRSAGRVSFPCTQHWHCAASDPWSLERVRNSDRWANEFDPVGVPHGGQSFRIYWAGQQRSKLFEEALKPRWRGDRQQPPWSVTDVLEAVRHTARPEGHAARRRPQHGITGLEPEVTFDHVPERIFTQVRVQRRPFLRADQRL